MFSGIDALPGKATQSNFSSLTLDITILQNRDFRQVKTRLGNTVDPDEMVHYEPSHLDLHCLQNICFAL